MKATLLSLLVFPGAGQFLLKKYKLGTILASIAFISLCVILANVVERSLEIAEKIQQGVIPLDTNTISALLLNQQTSTSASSVVGIASIVLILVWIASFVDAFITTRDHIEYNKR